MIENWLQIILDLPGQMKLNEMDISLTSYFNLFGSYRDILSQMNDMNDGPARDSNPLPLPYQANALPTELLGLAD